MNTPDDDRRSANRRAQDEQLAAAKQLPPLQLPSDAKSAPLETHLGRLLRPMAIAGVVENGVVRPLDPEVKLAEHSRVIIVASGGH